MKKIANVIHNSKDSLPTGDDLSQGTQEDKDSVHVEQPSINKNIPSGIDSNNGSNKGWSPRGIQLPKIDMRKFDGKDPITWIFQMEQLFDIHQVPNIQKVPISYLYLKPKNFVWFQ